MGLYDNLRITEILSRQDFPSFQSDPSPLNIAALQTLSLSTSMPSYQDWMRQQNNEQTPGLVRKADGSYGFTRAFLSSTPNLKKPMVDTSNKVPTRESLGVSTGPTAEQQKMLDKAKAAQGQRAGGGMQSQAVTSALGAVSGITGGIASALSDNDETQNSVREGVRGTIAQFGP